MVPSDGNEEAAGAAVAILARRCDFRYSIFLIRKYYYVNH
jgi:hypothetical protein